MFTSFDYLCIEALKVYFNSKYMFLIRLQGYIVSCCTLKTIHDASRLALGSGSLLSGIIDIYGLSAENALIVRAVYYVFWTTASRLRTKLSSSRKSTVAHSKPAIYRKRSSLRTIVDHLSCPAVPVASRMDTVATATFAAARDPINSILQ